CHTVNKLLCALLLFCVSALASGEEYSGRVISVLDGDTVLVSRDDRPQAPIKIRLANIDAPEKDQEYGMASRQSLLGMVLNKPVQVVTQAVDDFGRIIATLSAGDLNVNHAQVQRGWAWGSSRFHSNKILMTMQHEAQQNRRGLWAGANPVEPNIWRRNHAALPVKNLAVQAQDCGKRSCAQLQTCDKARQYFLRCGEVSLDGDRDGAPCENLCAMEKNKKN
ncbi:MAG: thermonuclease family protein, partial [Candidatus Nitrotoga sp.]